MHMQYGLGHVVMFAIACFRWSYSCVDPGVVSWHETWYLFLTESYQTVHHSSLHELSSSYFLVSYNLQQFLNVHTYIS